MKFPNSCSLLRQGYIARISSNWNAVFMQSLHNSLCKLLVVHVKIENILDDT